MRRSLTRTALRPTLVYSFVTSFAALLLGSCAGTNTAQRPAHIAAPRIEAALVGSVFFGSGTEAAATVEVRVTNTATVPITVTRLEVDSSGMVQWGLLRQERAYREVVEPGTTRAINFYATATTTTTRRSEPLDFNVRVHFEAECTSWQQFLRVLSTVPTY